MAAPPTIDVSPLRVEPGSAAAAACADVIHAACIDTGFFVASDHGLDAPLRDVFAAAHALFALPQTAKESIAMADRRGFVPARQHAIDHTLHSAPMEYYDVGMGGINRWPDPHDLHGFADVVVGYQTAALSTAADLLRAVAVTLDLEATFFADRMLDPQCFLRMMHYEPSPPGPDGHAPVLSEQHTDYGLITLLATDGVGGLEVRPRDGAWTPVHAPPGSLIVNLGDMLARWTNDRFVSTPHQVRAPATDHRYSVPFFVNPDPATTVACLPSCVTAERPCRYAPVTAGEFLAQRIVDGGYMADTPQLGQTGDLAAEPEDFPQARNWAFRRDGNFS
ncbi:MAG TPA: 2OG-Fe(II) oxygenase family protein [Ilumatobacteraceae bacterium]|nr:2OG-Fe(II) oxygenase family protein [Ilumatobacteraceae bacterium]